MGIWTEINLNDRPVFGWKNHLDTEFIEISFSKLDMCVEESSDYKSERATYNGKRYYLRSCVHKVIDRLQVYGIQLTNLEREYTASVCSEINNIKKELEQYAEGYDDKLLLQTYEEQLEFWQKMTLEDFLDAAKCIIIDGLYDTWESGISETNYSSVKEYLLSSEGYFIHRMPFDDPIYAFLAILSVSPSNYSIEYDYTSWIAEGEIDEPFKFHTNEEKIIVLTEGSSDIRVLKPSLEFFFPHLVELFHFMDFKSFKAQGGASGIVNILKAFAGAGVKNRIIALFDNDTAAREAQTQLDSIVLPENIKVLNYPELPLGINYPTIGPTGVQKMDINGLAGSIELYTGEDALRDEQGDFYPVQWKGYSVKMEAYQGEIMNKQRIQERYAEKLTNVQKGVVRDEYDWTGIHSILNSIITAL